MLAGYPLHATPLIGSHSSSNHTKHHITTTIHDHNKYIPQATQYITQHSITPYLPHYHHGAPIICCYILL